MDLSDFDPSLLVWEEDVVGVSGKVPKAENDACVGGLVWDEDVYINETGKAVNMKTDSCNSTEEFGGAHDSHHWNRKNSITPLLNTFVSAMADQSMANISLGSSAEGSFQYPLLHKNAPSLSSSAHAANPNDTNSSMSSYLQNHISANMIPTTLLPSSFTHNTTDNTFMKQQGYAMNPTTDSDAHQPIQPIFPPNYFLPPGTTPWEPSAAAKVGISSNFLSYGDEATRTRRSVSNTSQRAIGTQIGSVSFNESDALDVNDLVPKPIHHLCTHSQMNPVSQSFHMFEVPTELHSNFIRAQQFHGMADTTSTLHSQVQNDACGMSQNMMQYHDNNAPSQNRALCGDNSIIVLSPFHGGFVPRQEPEVRPVDDSERRHKSARYTDRNEREQRRAQQITELIEELRHSMVKAGWKVEMKSKYHTLSRCTEYLNYLKKTTKDKEDAIERTKADLSVRRQKLEEEKALLEGRSDPESVVSSLTNSSNDERRGSKITNSSGKNEEISNKKRKEHADGDNFNKKTSSKSENTGSDDGGDTNSFGGKNVSINKMCSSLSDITESNRSSRNDVNVITATKMGEVDKSEGKYATSSDAVSVSVKSSSSISSTAVVVSGVGSKERQDKQIDSVINGKRPMELSSLHKNFLVDYEEVFRTSNIPQLIASPSGRIIAYNDFFLRCTGLSESQTRNLTLFSFARADKLPDLFELVATFLKTCPLHNTSYNSSNGNQTDSVCSSTENSMKHHEWGYNSVTLPCTSFPAGNEGTIPLYMHITMLEDPDARRRCFHCIFTDIAGTEGKVGSISPQLLARIFSGRHE